MAGDNKTIAMDESDAVWARKLQRRIARQPFRSSADALIANELARAIKDKLPARLEYLLATPLPSLVDKHPKLPDASTVFADAWNNLSEIAREKARDKFPALYDMHGSSPLSAAVLAEFTAGAEILLARGAMPFRHQPSSSTGYGGALGAAIFYGKQDFMTLFMSQPPVQKELASQPAFRNYLLLTAVGTDCQATLDHLCKCDPGLAENARIYGGRKAADFTLNDGIFAARDRLKAKRAFDAAQNPPVSKYGKTGPSYRPAP